MGSADATGADRKRPAERQCVVTRRVLPVGELLRFVLDPDGGVVVDLKRNLPGRGVWVMAQRGKVEDAVRRRLFARGFRSSVKMPDDLAERVDQRLETAVRGALSMARKAGELVTGFGKVESVICGRRLAGVIHASDAAADGIRKLDAARRRRPAELDPVPVLRMLSSAQMNLALGETNVIHAALLNGRAGQNVIERAFALERFRSERDFSRAPESGMNAAVRPEDENAAIRPEDEQGRSADT